MDNQLFNLRFTSKSLVRSSKKCDQKQKQEKLKLKKAIEQGNHDGARIYAQNAIREKNNSLNYLRLSSKIDGVASRLEAAIRMNCVTRSMQTVVRNLDSSMKNMNLEKITLVMDKFEKQFEDLDVQADYVENAMSESVSTSTPVNEVDSLIGQVADEYGLEVGDMLGEMKTQKANVIEEQDELTSRLAKLKER